MWFMWHGDICTGCANHEFPYTAQNPFTKQMVTVSNADDLQALVLAVMGKCPSSYTLGKHLHLHARRIGCVNMFHDIESQKVIRRMLYCQRFNTPPFEGDYNDQPAWWIDMVAVLHNEQNELMQNG